MPEPTEVPRVVVDYVARQLDIADLFGPQGLWQQRDALVPRPADAPTGFASVWEPPMS